jgi:dTDP-4-amino-4,6-dideoxygalactose transaminase
VLPLFPENTRSSVNYFTIRISSSIKNRDELRVFLKTEGIASAVYYPLSLHLQEVYQYLGYTLGDLPNCEQAQGQVISLPMYPELSTEQVGEVATHINNFFAK